MTPRTGYTGYTEAQKRATMKYQKANLDAITLRFQKGYKEKLQAHLELTGEKQIEFIRRAIKETIERDKATMRDALRKQTLTAIVQEPEE